jgi:hypothetical protein
MTRPQGRATLRLLLAGLAAGSVLVLSATGASAGIGDPAPMPPPADTTDTGYSATALVEFSGDGAPVGSKARRRLRVPVTCWWTPAPGPSQDPQRMLAAYDSGTLAAATYARYAGRSWSPIQDQAHAVATARGDFEDAVKRAASGAKLAWYVAVCRDSATLSDYQGFVKVCPTGMLFAAYPVGQTPQPRVEPAALAQVARENLNLVLPAVDRNPKVTAAGGASLVGLPTWFWVTDPVAVGAPTGRRTIRAQVDQVWAEVVATTTGLHVTSPAGSATCTPARATVAWRSGIADSSACTLVFTKASVGYPSGYPVQASTTWAATWTGSDNTSGTLTALTRTVTVPVPVAEVQTIVTGIG